MLALNAHEDGRHNYTVWFTEIYTVVYVTIHKIICYLFLYHCCVKIHIVCVIFIQYCVV